MKPVLIIIVICVEISSISNSYAVGGDTRESELSYANSELNITYKKILLKLKQPDKIMLKKAQKAWMEFRDLDCKWAFKAEPLDCLIDRTTNRTKELSDTFY